MKVLIITNDEALMDLGNALMNDSDNQILFYGTESNPLSVIAFVYDNNPSFIIIDDDFLKPNSAQIIETIRKVNKNIPIVFATSNHSLELGKQIAQLGIHYYAIKPIETKEFNDLIKSVGKGKNKISY
jgi:DNA-binding NarL/FixJ family response regulator